ncbi:hypothetical protein FA13DRAFT_1807838 [Coprinellus micaceus]|uniref:Uncharacterized protein n=1 Tax=Coprinellus micaceus TaxID=71717 RepID=A0A4Y7R4K5_COPMI|nr:hypothetical protein FA13DRAFT_1807838 [Coprinellus micaceus]
MSSDAELNPFEQELLDSEDEIDWEEVEVPAHLDGKKKAEDESKKKGVTHEERLMRINCHKIHTVVLLANAKVRNRWINDELAPGATLVPHPIVLQNEFAIFTRHAYQIKASEVGMFERAYNTSFLVDVVLRRTIHCHIRNRTFDEVQSKLRELRPSVTTKAK